MTPVEEYLSRLKNDVRTGRGFCQFLWDLLGSRHKTQSKFLTFYPFPKCLDNIFQMPHKRPRITNFCGDLKFLILEVAIRNAVEDIVKML